MFYSVRFHKYSSKEFPAGDILESASNFEYVDFCVGVLSLIPYLKLRKRKRSIFNLFGKELVEDIQKKLNFVCPY